jgi:hypothetical protein
MGANYVDIAAWIGLRDAEWGGRGQERGAEIERGERRTGGGVLAAQSGVGVTKNGTGDGAGGGSVGEAGLQSGGRHA